MKAIVLDRPGSPGSLHLGEKTKPQPQAGEVRIRVHAVSLNPVDYKLAAGGHSAWHYPFVLGLDVAGTIDAIGSDVSDWQVGDRVFYHGNLSRPGGYAEYVVTVAHVLARIPENVTFVEAAAIPCAGLTAYQALFRKLHVQSGQTVLVHGGAGGVGGYSVQLAAHAGATVIATTSAHNFDHVQQLGAVRVIDYRTEDVAERVMALTNGRGVDAIVDSISSESATISTKLLAFGGGVACIAGMPDFSQVSFDKAISVHAVMLGGAYFNGDQAAQVDLAKMAEEMIALVAEKQIDPMVGEVISLEQIPQALTRLAARHVRGKIVAQIIS